MSTRLGNEIWYAIGMYALFAVGPSMAEAAVATTTTATATAPASASSKPVARPNVLLIISDDQGWTDFGFMGHKVVKTPSLDRLASRGVVFPNAYVTSSLCRPSLGAIITGLYGFQTNICGNDPPKDVPRELVHEAIKDLPTIPRLLAKSGYRSLQTGKFWEGSFANAGFTHGQTGEADRHGSGKSLEIGRDGLKPIFDFIAEAGDSPWFVWYAPMMPHEPHTPPERILCKYASDDRPIRLAKYYAMCEWFDETCGQLLDHLASRRHLDNTLVVFVTDNGWIQEVADERRGGCAPRSKRSPYDGGLRTPVILSWPGKIKPGIRSETISSIDLAPTILRACGVEPARQMSGINLFNVVNNRIDIKGRAVFSEVYANRDVVLNNPEANLLFRVIRKGKWKLILPKKGRLELFNMADDPQEQNDLSEEIPDRAAKLKAHIDVWWKPTPAASRPSR